MATHFPSREVILLFQNIQNLNLEYENRVGRDLVAGTTYTVAQFGGDIEDVFATLLHQLQTFAETFHYTGRREGSAGIGIELSTVDQCTFVRYFGTLVGLKRFALTGFNYFVEQTRFGLYYTLFFGFLGQEGFTFSQVFFSFGRLGQTSEFLR